MKVYKYLSGDDGSLRTLSEATIKFSDPRTFNDPFDCMPYIETPTVEMVLRDKPAVFETIYKAMNAKGSSKFQARRKAVANLKVSVESGKFLDQVIEGAKVLSLSKIPNDILMWSHYAKDHKGFVLEFDVQQEEIAQNILGLPGERFNAGNVWNLYFEEVIYSETRPVIPPYTNVDTPKSILNNLLLTKSKSWEYEQEVRVIDNGDGNGINNYNPKILKSVICGVKSSDEQKQILTELTQEFNERNNTNADVLYAAACEKTYSIRIPGLK